MKLTRSRYPDYLPPDRSSPCWNLTGRWLWADADWNTRWPFGVSLGVGLRRKPGDWTGPGFTLDLNAPLDEPSRLYLSGPRRVYTIGLLTWHREVEAGTKAEVAFGREIKVAVFETRRCRPRLVYGQAWDRKRSQWSPDSWRWITVVPNDWRERWARAHPEEAAALRARRAARRREEAAGD